MYYVSNNNIIKSSPCKCISLFQITYHVLQLPVVLSVSRWGGICSKQLHCFLYPLPAVCLLMSFSDSKYSVCIRTNAYCSQFWGRKFRLRMNFNTFNGSLLTKRKSKHLTTTCKASEALDGFQLYSVTHLAITPGLQNHTRTIQLLKNTYQFLSLHIFCLCPKCLLCFFYLINT